MPKIYESPDGGRTIYERNFGDTERKLLTNAYPQIVEPLAGTEGYGGIWKEVVGFPDWKLIQKHRDVRDAYEKFLKLQDQYKVLDDLADD
jgi:hypothetical protein